MRHSSKVCCRRARGTPSSDRGWKSQHWILTTWTNTDQSPTWASYRRPSNEWWRYTSMNTWKRLICCHRISLRTATTILPKPPRSTSTTEQCAIWTVASMPMSWSCYIYGWRETFQVSFQLSATFVIHCSIPQGAVLEALKFVTTQRTYQP